MDGERFALVTGAGSGVGKASALALARTGWHVALAGRRPEALEETAGAIKALGRRALPLSTDVGDPDAVKALFAQIESEFGRLDLLFNNAGRGAPAVPIDELPYETWKAVVDVNLNGTYWMAQACGRVMQPGSSIINIASVLGLTSFLMPQAAYSASKSAVIGLTRDLAQQWTLRKGIRVNALAPGYFGSEMTDQFEAGVLDRYVVPRTLFGRLGNEGELDAALIFLASDASSYITGITLPVDGGTLTN